jgi:hypothetical protein
MNGEGLNGPFNGWTVARGRSESEALLIDDVPPAVAESVDDKWLEGVPADTAGRLIGPVKIAPEAIGGGRGRAPVPPREAWRQ